MSTLVELWNLDQSQGPIDAGELADAIERGVGDLDGQAAGKEFDMVMDWASRNAHRLSPEARKVLDIYAKHAHAARAQGQSGIPQGEFRDMLAEMRNVKDVSVSVELERLDRTSGPVNGDQMADAIRRGVADLDGKAATEEFNQFAEWAEKNRDRLTPEAIEVLDIYTRYVESAQDRGLSGIPDGEFRNMVAEMDAVRDASVSKELSQLDKSQGPINGDQMTDAIRRGTQDADGKAATDEFKQFADWAKKNQHRLSPEAKQVMATYEKYAKAAQAKGQSGIAHNDYQKMLKEMRNVKDASVSTELSRLDRTQGPINGDQLAAAIRRGVGDADGKAATDEFKQFADWAKKNESRLSPEAKQVMAIYEKHAKAAQARGQSGLSDAEFRGMVKEMHAVRDASASQALLDLSLTPGRVGGRQMLDAIRRGTQDADGKAATDEFKMFADWARANPDKLTPEARRVLDVYKKYAQSAQAQGQSGIAHNDYQQMLREMKEAARPRPVFSLHAARAIAG
jgi:hypothetical protein